MFNFPGLYICAQCFLTLVFDRIALVAGAKQAWCFHLGGTLDYLDCVGMDCLKVAQVSNSKPYCSNIAFALLVASLLNP